MHQAGFPVYLTINGDVDKPGNPSTSDFSVHVPDTRTALLGRVCTFKYFELGDIF